MLKKTILLVEDEMLIALTEKRWLINEGFQVIHVSSGEQAIEIVKTSSSSIDLILMDIDLGQGRIDGTQAAREILTVFDIPLLFLSSHTEKEIVDRTEQITSYGYVVKGSNNTVLLASIKMAFKLNEADKEVKLHEKTLQESEFWLNESQRVAQIGHYRIDLMTGNWTSSKMLDEIISIGEDYSKDVEGWLNIVHPEDREMMHEYHNKVLRERIPFNKEYRIIRPFDGKILWLHEVGKLMLNDSGEPVSMFGTIQNITERTLAQKALKESEEKFRLLAENSLDLIYRYRIFQEPGFEYVSPSATTITGYTPEEHYADPELRYKLVHFDDRHLMEESMQNNREKNNTLILRWVRKDGQVCWTEQRNTVIYDEAGNMTAIEGIVRDITESKQNELQLANYSRELKSLNITKDKLFSILAHDLRGPLGGFLGLTEALANNVDSLEKQEIAQFSSVMHTTSKSIYELFTNLLEWSRLQTGKLEFKPSEFDLFSRMETIFQLFSSASVEKSLRIKNEIPQNIFVFADINMVSTILRNLISNAIKFTGSGGTIITSASPLGKFAEISVADSGVGMTEEAIDKIFRIDSGFTTMGTNNEKGSGLGLALCKELIKKNGGQINVMSTPEKGTTFTFTLIRHQMI